MMMAVVEGAVSIASVGIILRKRNAINPGSAIVFEYLLDDPGC